MDAMVEVLEHALENAFEVKDKKSLHRYVLLLTENILRIVRKESYEKQQLETKSDIKNLFAGSLKQQESNFTDQRFDYVDKRFEDMARYMDQRFEDMNNRIKHI